MWVICALLDPDPDPATQINADPSGSGSASVTLLTGWKSVVDLDPQLEKMLDPDPQLEKMLDPDPHKSTRIPTTLPVSMTTGIFLKITNIVRGTWRWAAAAYRQKVRQTPRCSSGRKGSENAPFPVSRYHCPPLTDCR